MITETYCVPETAHRSTFTDNWSGGKKKKRIHSHLKVKIPRTRSAVTTAHQKSMTPK